MARVLITEGFEDDLDMVLSDRVLEDILHTVALLKIVPSMGSSDVPVSIARKYGEHVSKIPVKPFDIITKYDEDQDTVVVLGLIHQRAAW